MAVRYEYYRCFYYAAKYQNLTQAAASLQTSQPNMTRILRSLERELGCRLMLRSNRGVTLTEEGERLDAHVAAAFEELRLGEELFAPGGALRGGAVSAGLGAFDRHGMRRQGIKPAVRSDCRLYAVIKPPACAGGL